MAQIETGGGDGKGKGPEKDANPCRLHSDG